MTKQNPNPPSAPKMKQETLDALKKKMLKNLSDPKVEERVDAAEKKLEEQLREEAGKIGPGKGKTP